MTTNQVQTAAIPAEVPPIPGGGSWRLVNNKWVPAEQSAPAEPVETKPTEE